MNSTPVEFLFFFFVFDWWRERWILCEQNSRGRGEMNVGEEERRERKEKKKKIIRTKKLCIY